MNADIFFTDTIPTLFEAITLLLIFRSLFDHNPFIRKNILRVILFSLSYVTISYWATMYIPFGYHTAVIFFASTILLSYFARVNVFVAIATFFVFTLIFASVFELLFLWAAQSIMNVPAQELVANMQTKLILVSIIKPIEVLLAFVLPFEKLHLNRFKIFSKENNYISTFVLQVSVLGLLFFCLLGLKGNQSNIRNNYILIISIFVIIFVVGILDYRDKMKETIKKMKIENDNVQLMEMTHELGELNKKMEDEISERKVTEWRLEQKVIELQTSKKALCVSEERYRLALDSANDCIWYWDISNDISDISPDWAETLGFPSSCIENFYSAWFRLIHPDDVAIVKNNLQAHIEKMSDLFYCEYRIRRHIGDYIWILSKGKIAEVVHGHSLKLSGSHMDITERKTSDSKIHRLAYYDSLTNLPNRTYLLEKLDSELQNSMAPSTKTALFFIDIDNFKSINDMYGHNIGDEFLIEVARRLRTIQGENITIARHGGDEFILVFRDAYNSADINEFAITVTDIFKIPWNIDRVEYYPTISMGITVYPNDGNTTNILLKNADMAMYKAKESGKNNYQYYDPSMYQEMVVKSNLEKTLNRAMENDEFMVYYQPQIVLASGKVIGMEALIRWINPDHEFVPPKTFIPLAEKSGLILSIGKYVLHTACLQNKKWQDTGYGFFTISVNISAIELQQESFIQNIKDVLLDTGLCPEYLEIEITESAIIENFDANNITLMELRDLGVRISLDDFGTGYSSLSYLNRLPINNVKIDKSFADGIMNDSSQKMIVESILDLSHKMGLSVTAEGVELKEQMDYLSEKECDIIQGYYICRPISAEAVSEWLSIMTP